MYTSQLIPVKKTLKIIGNVKTTVQKENLALDKANGRVLSEDIQVLIDVPPFDRAAMDGYAVRAEDCGGSSESAPIYLELVDDVGAGDVSTCILGKNETIRIATGAQMPQGSGAVVMEEYTELVKGKVKITSPVNPNQDVALKGEDLKKGKLILKRKQILGPHHLSIIASSGYKTVDVLKKPKIGVIITGDELVEPSNKLKPGVIINSNKYALNALVEDSLAVPFIKQCPDDLKIMTDELKHAADKYDALITTGGTAISKGDLVVDVVQKLGTVLMHGVSIKPGKPFGFGVIKEKPVFMLSGYPVAAAVQFDIFVRNYLLNMQDIPKKFDLIKCGAGSNIRSFSDKCNVIRADFNEKENVVYPLRTKAGINKSITNSNCYIISPEGVGKIRKGEECRILKYSSFKIS